MSGFHDFGTVRVYDSGEELVVSFGKSDTTTREILRGLKSYFDGGRRAWRVVPRYSRTTKEGAVEAIRNGLTKAAPEGWTEHADRFSKLKTTTRQFGLAIGIGGVRFDLPRGYKHEWTLNDLVKEKIADKEGVCWTVSAAHCNDPRVNRILQDIVVDDQKALDKAIGYLDGFAMKGPLTLAEEEVAGFGLSVPAGTIIYAEPSFVRAADPSIPVEPIDIYPLRLLSFAASDEGWMAKLSFVVGSDAFKAIRRRNFGDDSGMPKALSARQCAGRWTRRRE